MVLGHSLVLAGVEVEWINGVASDHSGRTGRGRDVLPYCKKARLGRLR